MSLLVKGGTLTAPGSVGTQVIDGIGFQPKFIIFLGNNHSYTEPDPGNPSGPGDVISLLKDASVMFGCGVSSSDNKVQSFLSGNGVDISNTYVSRNTSKCIRVISPNPLATKAEASIQSMDADGFTLNWTTVDQSLLRDVHYIAFGGDTLLNAKSGSSTTPTTASNKSVTGLGFQPDLLILFAFSAATTLESSGNSNVSGSIGFTSRTEQGYVGFRLRNSAGTTVTKTRFSNTKCFSHVSDSDVFAEASLVSFDSDGFTLNWNTVSGTLDYFYYLAIRGGAFKIGTILQPVSSGLQDISGLGFPPKGSLLLSDNKESSSSTTDNARFSMTLGVSSVDSRSIWMGDRNSVNTSVSYSDFDPYPSFKMMAEGSPYPTINAFGYFQDNYTNNFKIRWSSVDATARQILYVAFGDKIISDDYRKFLFYGKNTSSNISKFTYHGKNTLDNVSKFIFQGRLTSSNVNKFVYHGINSLNKYNPFIYHGKSNLDNTGKFAFNGKRFFTSYGSFVFNGKIDSIFYNSFQFQGLFNLSDRKNFVFNGYSLKAEKFNLIFEGNSTGVDGNWGLYRVFLTGLPTTSEITAAKLALTVGFTSGSYTHELWSLNATGRGWSDTEATWNDASSGIQWSQGLGIQYGGGYSDRLHKLSEIQTSQDEQRVFFNLNSTGLSYVKNNAGGSVEFILLSNYTGNDYAYYRPVEDPTESKRPEFFVDYTIPSPFQAKTNNFIFHGINQKDDLNRFIFHGINIFSKFNSFVLHGLDNKTTNNPFVLHGKSDKDNTVNYQFHGKVLESKAIPFIFFTRDLQDKTCNFLIHGVSQSTNTSRYVFNGSVESTKFSRFIFSGNIDAILISRFIFNGISSKMQFMRFCFDSGIFQSNRFSFLFEGKSSIRMGYEIKDHSVISIKEKNRELIKDNVREYMSDKGHGGIYEKQSKNIKTR